MTLCDSLELTKWLAFFDAKRVRDRAAYEQAKKDATFEEGIERG